jgi:hypothetical protein
MIPVREMVRTYESTRHLSISSTASSAMISPVVEELHEMIQEGTIPEGMVQDKVHVVESLPQTAPFDSDSPQTRSC